MFFFEGGVLNQADGVRRALLLRASSCLVRGQDVFRVFFLYIISIYLIIYYIYLIIFLI